MIIMALVCTGAVFYMSWLGGAFLPRWIDWRSGNVYGKADTGHRYEIVLSGKRAEVLYDNSVIWNSPDGMKVQQAISCDIDNDQEEELVLLCWKIGRFGESRPFWVDRDERKWSQHLFLYEYDQGKIRPKWMSSYIGQDVAEMWVGENWHDRSDGSSAECSRQSYGRQEDGGPEDGDALYLGSPEDGHALYRDGPEDGGQGDRNALYLSSPDGKISRWVWGSWGFRKEETEVSFTVFGDLLAHEPIYRYGLQHGGNFGFLFEKTKGIIAQSDIAVINQETPLTDHPALYGDYPRFGTPAGVGKAVADAGFDVVTCATNHALDRGAEGVDFTKKFYDALGVTCLGIQSIEERNRVAHRVIVKNGIRFAMLNYTYGTNGIRIPEEYPDLVHLLADEDRIRKEIEAARAESDFVIVFVHWGTEYAETPDDFQKEWTRIFLESGVDAVIGTHPHVLQPYEIVRDGDGHEMLVYYSIGNYISAQHETSCVKGGMAQFTVSLTTKGYRITEYTLQPLTITRQEDGRYTVEREYDREGF